LKIDRANLVGHSMGALIVGQAAIRYPRRVSSASLVGGPFFADSATYVREASRWLRDLERGAGLSSFLKWLFPGMPDSLARGFSAQTMMANDSASLVTTMRSTAGLLVTRDRAVGASVPVLIAAGGGDPLAPLSRTLASQWPNAQLVDLPGVDHLQIVSRPEVIAAMRAIIR
jgi:pimeloyl-ACP methyl ester carboxylesterase